MLKYDAVVASTGPSLEIDSRRVYDAVNAVLRIYGNLRDYNGLWIVAGTLGGQIYETSQRARMIGQFERRGIEKDKIRVIGGEDTMDKVREIINLSKNEGLSHVGISTYFLHFLRYWEGLSFAKRESLAPKSLEFKLIWSPTPARRWHKDMVYGIVGLGIETTRLLKYGFSESSPKNKPLRGASSSIKEWASEDDDQIPLG